MSTVALVFTCFLFVAVALGFILVTLPRLLAPRVPNVIKESTYECGEIPVGEPWIRFRIGYYLFALAFLIFDVESLFLYPWAMILRQLGWFGIVQMLVFIGMLGLGLGYVWRKGVLSWN